MVAVADGLPTAEAGTSSRTFIRSQKLHPRKRGFCPGQPGTLPGVSVVLLATDSDGIYDEIEAAVGGTYQVSRVRAGEHVQKACEQLTPDVILLDLQIGNMGGMATSMLLKQEMRAGRLDDAEVLMLLDREADVWLAGQAEADGWLVKPLNSIRIRKAVQALLDGDAVREGPAAQQTSTDLNAGDGDAEGTVVEGTEAD